MKPILRDLEQGDGFKHCRPANSARIEAELSFKTEGTAPVDHH